MVKGLLPITAVKYRRVTQVLYANEPVGNSSTEFNSVLFPQRQFTIIVASITASVLQVKKKRKQSKPQEFDDTLRAALGNSRKKDFPFNRKRPLTSATKLYVQI